jgi:hypothetical protein
MLFPRSDGVVVQNVSNVRRMMPYLMRGRNESVVWHQQDYDLTKTSPWLETWNRDHPDTPATLFHLLMYSLGRVFHERPGLNRFVSGGRIYQRNHVDLSFDVKVRMAEDAPVTSVKMRVPRDEPFVPFMARITQAIAAARVERPALATAAARRVLALPAPLARGAMTLLRTLDAWNLLPAKVVEGDPFYTTAYVANLGSVGIQQAFHHLSEYGTASFFGSLGEATRAVVVARDGRPAVRESVRVWWSFDERINDGFYCASSLKIPQRVVEDPGTFTTASSPA